MELVHVWPAEETFYHDLETADCPCGPDVREEAGCYPVVSHRRHYLSGSEWRVGRSNGYPADFSFRSVCCVCGAEECTVVEASYRELMPLTCLDYGFTGECGECGGMTMIPEWRLRGA